MKKESLTYFPISIFFFWKWKLENQILFYLCPKTKAPTSTEKLKKQRDNTETPQKSSITQRLRTDLGMSVRVTIAIQMGLLNRFIGSHHSH